MPKEIERKFLVRDPSVLSGREGRPIVQGYLSKGSMTVRIRTVGDEAFLTLKGRSCGLARDEFEYPIPRADALEMLETYCGDRLIRKTRFLVPYRTHVFEVDVFEGGLAGLVIAEVELAGEDEWVDLPDWIGPEVTHDSRFGNFDLAQVDSPPLFLPQAAARLAACAA